VSIVKGYTGVETAVGLSEIQMEVYKRRPILAEVIIWDIDVLLSDVLTPTYNLASVIIHLDKNRMG
jgi:hypothetical protein